jgi:ATP-dependent DNA helicase DinG
LWLGGALSFDPDLTTSQSSTSMIYMTTAQTPRQSPAPRTFTDVEALLADALEGYSPRPPQQVAAKAIETALAGKTNLLLEAGCGCGKSLAYLIPAILSGRRTIVATATRALQHQLVSKDLPFLQDHLKFSWAMLQGRSRYLCTARAHVAQGVGENVSAILQAAQRPGFSGLREDLGFVVPDALWSKVCSEAEACFEAKCNKTATGCFAAQARREAMDAQVVVVNHALLCMELVMSKTVGLSMLGEYDQVIVDEAHELEGFAKSALGGEISQGSITSTLAAVLSFAHQHNFSQEGPLKDAADRVNTASALLWMAFSSLMVKGETTLRIRPKTITDIESEWTDTVDALQDFAGLVTQCSTPTDRAKALYWRGLVRRSQTLAGKFSSIVMDDFSTTVRWLETQTLPRTGDSRIVAKWQPIFVDEFLAETLFAPSTVVCTSATLQIKHSFDFVARKLGIGNYTALDVGTMFDFPAQGAVFIPRALPAPTGPSLAAWEAQVPSYLIELLQASEGRALLLFTSVKAMKRAYDAIASKVPYTCLMQGQDSVPNLTAQFKADNHSVLFGTRSFMTGLDIQGESCSLVVLDKLTFTVPNEPAFEAESDVINSRGGNAFGELAIPSMLLTLRQSAGRLIRTVSDRGVFVLLDSRVYSKSYGSGVFAALPPFSRVESVEEAKRFFPVSSTAQLTA